MSPARRSGENPGGESFADAIGDAVEPLPDRPERVAAPTTGARRPKAREPARFDFPDVDEPLLGIAAGIQTSQLRRLRGGRIPCERRIDLHGYQADSARRELLESLLAAIDEGERCVLVVHGKGLRSKGDPVLRRKVPDWLADPKLGGHVLAFAPATPEDGGRGATYVLLRRRRD